MNPIHERLYSLASESEPDAAKELTECAKAACDMLEALKIALASKALPGRERKVVVYAIAKAEGQDGWKEHGRTVRGRFIWTRTMDGQAVYQMTPDDAPPSPGSGGYPVLDSLLKLKGDRMEGANG